MTTQSGDRSIYLDDFADEILVCEPTLEGWAEWLVGAPYNTEGGDAPYPAKVSDGQSFGASAILWGADIVATRDDGKWSLSRELAADDFVAVRFAEGLGWSPENIVTARFDWRDGEYVETGTLADALLQWLSESDEFCDDREWIACGKHENDLRVTFHAGPPPTCTIETSQ